MKVIRLIIFIILFFATELAAPCAVNFADNYKVKDLITDNSDRMILIVGEGNFRNKKPLTTDIAHFTLNNPYRYVVDIPNAVLVGASRDIKLNNSSSITNIRLSQFSLNPNVVRATFTVKSLSDLSKMKLHTNGSDIVLKYANSIIDNYSQYKFYTPLGDSDKSAKNQALSATITSNDTGKITEFTPKIQTKFYLSQIQKISQGVILKGLGSAALQRTIYNPDSTKAETIIDSASISPNLENTCYSLVNPLDNSETKITIQKNNQRSVKITLLGNNLKDYRYIISPDGQSVFIAHRTHVLNTVFSSSNAAALNYSVTKTQAGYKLFEILFSNKITYDVFELNDNFYLDINNLADYSELKFSETFKDEGVSAIKIAVDKTRFIIPTKNMKFAYANIDSNATLVKLCFKENNPEAEIQAPKQDEIKKDEKENINVVYVPKEEPTKVVKPKKPKENAAISSIKRVVLDPGHGGADCGAIALDNKYYEKTINLEVAQMVKERLKKKNIYVDMTRDKDMTLTLEERVNFSNDINPDIYVSIHANSTLQNDKYGLETHYYKDNSLDLANIIHSNFASAKNLKKWETKDRGVIKSRFYVINHTEAPAVLIEIGFISNEVERDKLEKKERKEEIADAIAQGILEYLKVK